MLEECAYDTKQRHFGTKIERGRKKHFGVPRFLGYGFFRVEDCESLHPCEGSANNSGGREFCAIYNWLFP